MPLLNKSRDQIRQLIRAKRRALSNEEQIAAGDKLVKQVKAVLKTLQVKKVALYLDFDGEIHTQPLINYCWKKEIEVYLPQLDPLNNGYLLFLRYFPHSKTRLNRFLIKEPILDKSALIAHQDLDIIFMPLVAFDKKGQRLGMGGGFYDRTLSPIAPPTEVVTATQNEKQAITPSPQNKSMPLRIGLAHDCQCIDKVPTERWDLSLSVVLTPSRIYTQET